MNVTEYQQISNDHFPSNTMNVSPPPEEMHHNRMNKNVGMNV